MEMFTAKKQRERFYLDAFLSQLGWSDWHVRDEHPEPPDFIVATPAAPVGVEVTTLNKDEGERGSPARARESAHATFLDDLAYEYYNGQGGEPLHVNLLLYGRPLPAMLPRLAAILRSRRPIHVGEDARVEVREPLMDGHAIFYLRTLPDEWQGHRRWQCVSDAVGWVRFLTADEIAVRIERKARRLAACQQVVERVLLLLVADRRKDSGRFDLASESMGLDKRGFSDVYLLVYPQATYNIGGREDGTLLSRAARRR